MDLPSKSRFSTVPVQVDSLDWEAVSAVAVCHEAEPAAEAGAPASRTVSNVIAKRIGFTELSYCWDFVAMSVQTGMCVRRKESSNPFANPADGNIQMQNESDKDKAILPDKKTIRTLSIVCRMYDAKFRVIRNTCKALRA